MTFSLLYSIVLLLLQVVGLILSDKLFNAFWEAGIRSAFLMTTIEFAFWVVAAFPISLSIWILL